MTCGAPQPRITNMQSVNNIKIRKAKEGDYEIINQLYCDWQNYHASLLPTVFKKFTKKIFIKRGNFITLITDNDSTVLVAIVDNQIIGLVEIVFDNVSNEDDRFPVKRASVEYLYVRPNFRRSGVGLLLLEAAKEWAKKKGKQVLTTSVYVKNKAALDLYNKAGFQEQVIRQDLEL